MKDYWKGFVVGLACTVMVGSAGRVIYDRYFNQSVVSDPKVTAKLNELEYMIDKYYLNEIDREKLADGLYTGLVYGLDDVYSRYYTEEEYKAEMTESDGSYAGIGVQVEEAEEGIRVAEVFENSPAREAGLQAGDVITAIDGERIREYSLQEGVALMSGQEKDRHTLTILRDGESFDVTLEIRQIEMVFVESRMLQDQVGYIRIKEFGGVTYDQYHSAFENLKEQGMNKLIVDLRDNPGGYLSTVCSILREILPEGLIVYTEDKYGEREEETCDGKHALDMPLVVLVNGESASASEIFAGAVQDYGVGTLVGTTTFGKGIVQTITELPDGGAIKLTVSHYYTPNGHDIHKVGIVPDEVVEMKESVNEVSEADDVQLQKALELLTK